MHFRLLIVAFGLFGFFTGMQVNAQSRPASDSKSIVVEPYLQEVVLEPTDVSKNFKIQITNNTGSDFNFNMSAVDFGTLNETGGLFFTGLESVKLPYKYGLTNWLELDKANQSLRPGQKTTISVTLHNRGDLTPGGHYGAIFINSIGAERKTGQPNVNFRQTVSPLIFATKRGGERYDLSLDSLTHNGNWLRAPNEVKLKFKNNGNTHVVPRGIVNITGNNGAVYAKGVINENSSYVLPETQRAITATLRQQKNYPISLIRSYKVESNYRYDGLDRFAVKTYTFRLINWPVLMGLLIFLAVVFFAINYQFGDKIEKYRKTAIKKAAFKKLFRR